jgi:hypothetical protein
MKLHQELKTSNQDKTLVSTDWIKMSCLQIMVRNNYEKDELLHENDSNDI